MACSQTGFSVLAISPGDVTVRPTVAQLPARYVHAKGADINGGIHSNGMRSPSTGKDGCTMSGQADTLMPFIHHPFVRPFNASQDMSCFHEAKECFRSFNKV